MRRHLPLQPALVAHQRVQQAQVTPAPPRLRIVRRQAVENFRLNNTLHVR